jgi:GTP-binding protein Era
MLEQGVGNKDTAVPVVLVLNKKDMIKPGEIAKKLEVRNLYKIEYMVSDLPCFLYLQMVHFMTLFLQWYQKFTNVDDVIPISAKFGHGVDDIKEWILSKLPLGPAYYPKVLAWKMQKFPLASSEQVLISMQGQAFSLSCKPSKSSRNVQCN